MPMKNRPRKLQLIFFFIAFVLLFVLVFTLGIIIGKGLGGSRYVERNVEQSQPMGEENTQPPVKDNEDANESANMNQVTLKHAEGEQEKLPEKEIKLKEPPQISETPPAEKVVEKTQPEKAPENTGSMKEELELRETPSAEKNTGNTGSETRVAKIEKETDISSNSLKLPETDPGGKFTVQLGSFKSREMAFDLEKKLSSRGYPSFVRKVVIPDKGEWYRVRVGTFNDKSKAESYGKILKGRVSFLKDIYVTNND